MIVSPISPSATTLDGAATRASVRNGVRRTLPLHADARPPSPGSRVLVGQPDAASRFGRTIAVPIASNPLDTRIDRPLDDSSRSESTTLPSSGNGCPPSFQTRPDWDVLEESCRTGIRLRRLLRRSSLVDTSPRNFRGARLRRSDLRRTNCSGVYASAMPATMLRGSSRDVHAQCSSCPRPLTGAADFTSPTRRSTLTKSSM